MDNSLGNKLQRQTSSLGNKSQMNTHSMGIKSHQIIKYGAKGTASGNAGSISSNSQLDPSEPVGLKNTGISKPKKSYLEK
jgi:hypothetical protein